MSANLRQSRVMCIVAAAFLFGTAVPLSAQQLVRRAPNPKVERGRILFEHKWTKNDALSPNGDGLGPMRNESSCVACHQLGGVGGAGSDGHNVQLLTGVRPHEPNDETRQHFRGDFRNRLSAVHPNFRSPDGLQSTVVLHRFGANDDYQLCAREVLGRTLIAHWAEARAGAQSRPATYARSSRCQP